MLHTTVKAVPLLQWVKNKSTICIHIKTNGQSTSNGWKIIVNKECKWFDSTVLTPNLPPCKNASFCEGDRSSQGGQPPVVIPSIYSSHLHLLAPLPPDHILPNPSCANTQTRSLRARLTCLRKVPFCLGGDYLASLTTKGCLVSVVPKGNCFSLTRHLISSLK